MGFGALLLLFLLFAPAVSHCCCEEHYEIPPAPTMTPEEAMSAIQNLARIFSPAMTILGAAYLGTWFWVRGFRWGTSLILSGMYVSTMWYLGWFP